MAYRFGGRRQPLTSVLDSLLILKVGHEWRSVVSRSPSQPEPRGSFSIASGKEGRSSAGVDGRPRPRGHGVTGSGLPRSRPALSLATMIGGSLLLWLKWSPDPRVIGGISSQIGQVAALTVLASAYVLLGHS